MRLMYPILSSILLRPMDGLIALIVRVLYMPVRTRRAPLISLPLVQCSGSIPGHDFCRKLGLR